MIFKQQKILCLISIFLFIIPIIEIYITEKNKLDETFCDYIMNIGLVDWSIIKNILSILLSFIIILFISLNKYDDLRDKIRNIIYIINILLLLWLIIGLDLLFRNCVLSLSSDIVFFNVCNILLGFVSIIITFYVVFISMKYEPLPLLNDDYDYI
jgi:hypothetical protein